MDASFAVTAWTREVQDEHRLLSQVLAVLYAFPELPAELLAGTLATRVDIDYPLTTRVGAGQDATARPTSGRPSAASTRLARLRRQRLVRARHRASSAAPQVRTQTVRTRLTGAGVHESREPPQRRVVADGDGASGRRRAWVALPALGRFAAADGDGRFRLDQLPAGQPSLPGARAPTGSRPRAADRSRRRAST